MDTADLGALLLADARLPTGAHAHSAGLEPALVAGLRADRVPAYIDSRLRTVALVEASAAALTLRLVRSDPSASLRVQDELLARMPTAPSRRASQLLGRGLHRLAVRLWGDHPAVRGMAGLDGPPLRPIALGVVAAALGMREEQVARASLYDDVQTITAAALKLLPVDPTDATAWLLASAPALEAGVAAALLVDDDPTHLPAHTAPLVEQHALDHHTRTRRIFVA
ncbi:urease accessory protein UreF [Janibacter sp. Soil728]|uniref:urease accessory protein UreF n=1 Tax=Janibacter sp. Soil728 TaxID=1736393 RepID=UPI000A52D61D|nr:urease accessory UreF family protein [Janibacter sp. Soil728]